MGPLSLPKPMLPRVVLATRGSLRSPPVQRGARIVIQ